MMTDKLSDRVAMAEGPSRELDHDDWNEGECFQCGGEGYVYGCSWDWQCDTYDEGEGTCLCTRQCDVCNPRRLTPDEQREKDELQAILADALRARGL